MSDQEERTRIAADLLRIDPQKTPDVPREVQRRVRAMNQDERAALTDRIDGVREWVADYELKEIQMAAGGAR